MSNYSVIDQAIRDSLENGCRQFIIFPFGQDCMLAKQIFNLRYNITEMFLVDNLLAKWNPNILTIEHL